MLTKRVHVAFITALAAYSLSIAALAQDQPASGANAHCAPGAGPSPAAAAAPAVPQSPATKAMEQASKVSKYIFILFYRADDEPTQAARKILDTAMTNLTDRAVSTVVDIGNMQEQGLVNKYGLTRAPMPLVLAIAPNGAVTRGFPGKFTEEQLSTAFVSPGLQKCLKALQDRKMVFVCVQNDKTQHNTEALGGVMAFATDLENVTTTAIVTIDPANADEESFLKQLKVDPKTDEAITVFLAPPGAIVGTYKGAVSKDVLTAAAKNAAKGCDPKTGCCPAPAAKPAAAPQPAPEKKAQ